MRLPMRALWALSLLIMLPSMAFAMNGRPYPMSLISGASKPPPPSLPMFMPRNSTESVLATHEARRTLPLVASVSMMNIMLNTIRPDASISWNMRLPRILWEVSIGTVARITASSLSPSLCIVMMLMLISTALIDIFLWAPLFAAAVEFHTCKGGWWTGQPKVCRYDPFKGYGRLLVVAQSIWTGMVYLTAGVSSWSAYVAQRDQRQAERDAQMWERLAQMQRAY